MKILFFPLLLVVLITSSCTIEQNIHFNNDMSGTSSFSIDMADAKNFMKGMDDKNSDGEEKEQEVEIEEEKKDKSKEKKSIEEVKEKLAKVVGISNIKLFEEDEKIGVSYNFNNLDALNNALNQNPKTGSPVSGKNSFKGDNKKLCYSFDLSDKGKKNEMDSKMMEGMMEYFKFRVVVSFDKEIKRVRNKHAIISSDRKSVTFTASVDEVMSGERNPKMRIKLK